MQAKKGIFKLQADLLAAKGQTASAASLTRRHYDRGQALRFQSGKKNAPQNVRARPFSVAPPPAGEPFVEPFGDPLRWEHRQNVEGGCNPTLIAEQVERQTYRPDLHVSPNNGTLQSGPEPRPVNTQPAPHSPEPTPINAPAPKTQSVSDFDQMVSAFNFDEADSLFFNADETGAPKTFSADADPFERELAHLLTGNVPERVARKLEEEPQQPKAAAAAKPVAPPPVQPAAPANPHDVFEKISEARFQSRVFDAGTFELQQARLDDFDRVIAAQKQADRPKSVETIAFEPVQPLVHTPETVNMSALDLAEDFHRMGVAREQSDKGIKVPANSNPENQASPPTDAQPQTPLAPPPEPCTCHEREAVSENPAEAAARME